MISTLSMEIQSLVNDIRDGKLLLPELQRRYIWKSTQVRDLFDSLYNNYPSGQLLVWETNDLPYSRPPSIGGVTQGIHPPRLLLDGQQRLTSLAAVMLGQPLMVRDLLRPIDIMFNVNTEKFEVAGPSQRGEYGWISLTKLFTQGEIAVLMDLRLDLQAAETQQVLSRLMRVNAIKQYKYHVNLLKDLPYEVVTHIFVRVNSAGTRLSTADLALAQLSSRWRGVSEDFADYQRQVARKGLVIDTSIFVRCISMLLTGQSRLGRMFTGSRQNVQVEELQSIWQRAKRGLDQAIEFLIHNCKIDRLNMLPTHYILIPLMGFFDRFGSHVNSAQTRALQRWVYMALIWARYSGTTETALDQDFTALSKDDPIGIMVQYIEDKVGRRPVSERELRDQLRNSPYMLMSYVLARQANAQDWFNGVVIGGSQSLELHHIFPKALLRQKYDLRADSRTVDQVANLAFLSQPANAQIASRSPADYLSTIDEQRLNAQSVPLDTALWQNDRFEDFVLARRTALANAINQLLQSLTEAPSLWVVSDSDLIETRIGVLERQLRELVATRLTASRGLTAWDLVPTEIRNNVQSRIDARLRNHPYGEGQHETLEAKLNFCQFSDYAKIIRTHWVLFQDVFGADTVFQQHIKAVTDVRNAIAHNRETSSSERALAEGGLLWFEECLRRMALKTDASEMSERAA